MTPYSDIEFNTHSNSTRSLTTGMRMGNTYNADTQRRDQQLSDLRIKEPDGTSGSWKRMGIAVLETFMSAALTEPGTATPRVEISEVIDADDPHTATGDGVKDIKNGKNGKDAKDIKNGKDTDEEISTALGGVFGP